MSKEKTVLDPAEETEIKEPVIVSETDEDDILVTDEADTEGIPVLMSDNEEDEEHGYDPATGFDLQDAESVNVALEIGEDEEFVLPEEEVADDESEEEEAESITDNFVAASVAESEGELDDVSDVVPSSRVRLNRYEREMERELQQATTAAYHAAVISYAAFRDATKGKIIRVKIHAVGEFDGIPCWISHIGPVTAVIPFHLAFSNNPEENTKAGRRAMLNGCIGKEIPIIVLRMRRIDNNRYVAFGNHVAALMRIRGRYFGPKAVIPTHAGLSYRYPAEVMSVQDKTMYVECRGIEFKVPIAEISWRYIADLPMTYAPGEKIYVVFDRIYDAEGNLNPRIIPRDAEIPQFKQLLRENSLLRQKDQTSTGTITSVRYKYGSGGRKSPDRIHISGFNENLGIPFFAEEWNTDFRENLITGDRVQYTVLNANVDTGFTLVRIDKKLKR